MTADEARRWCVEAVPALAAGADPASWAEGLVAVAASGDVGLVRPAVAHALAERADDPAVLPALAAYVRSAPPDEALEFAAGWAVDAWAAYCAAPGRDHLPEAMALAGLAIAHVMETSSAPPLQKRPYNAAVETARDLFIALARLAPADGAAPPGLLAELLAAAQGRAADLGFATATAARIPSLVRICRDYGDSLPRANPGLRYLA